MKTIALTLALFGLAGAARAIDSAQLDDRIRTLTGKLDALQFRADRAVPPETLAKAQGIILLDRTKAGFIFAYQGGGGVALVRDPKTRRWSPAAFVSANEASLGFQVGGEQNFYVILLMTTNATRYLTEPNFDFAGEASGTAGDTRSGVGTDVATTGPPVLVYDEHKGLYGGASVKGGAISPDNQANQIYYGQPLAMQDILFDKKVKPTAATTDLIAKIDAYSKPAKK